jgi:hypothetical protein
VGWGAGEAGGIDGEGEIEGKRRWGGGRESGRLTGEGEWRVGSGVGGGPGGVGVGRPVGGWWEGVLENRHGDLLQITIFSLFV